jgi:hypothetical protein
MPRKKKAFEGKTQLEIANGILDRLTNSYESRIDALKTKNKKMEKALKMWVAFWNADNDFNSLEPLLAEEAMEATREVLGEDL